MEDKKPCLRCDRAIDPYARICPYCNWDQTNPAPPPAVQQAASAQTPSYVPPQDRSWRRHLVMIGGGIAVLILAFVVGAFINSEDTPENAPKPVTDEIGIDEGIARTRRADVTLVPVDEATGFETPITSAPVNAPAEGVPAEYQRSDATAVSSVEYAALAQRVQAEKKAKQMVDPRSLTGPAYAQAPRPAAPRQQQQPQQTVPPPMTSAAREDSGDESGLEAESATEPRIKVTRRTRPVPEDQPLPRITVSAPVTARLTLMVGADGRVKSVNLRNGIPGHTPALIAAVQSWRFKPATENGVPVSAPFSVDISFNP